MEVFKAIMLLITAVRILNFMRIYESWGTLVRLVSKVFVDIFQFTGFFLAVIFIIALGYKIFHVQFEDEDYPDMNDF